jgi:hypothetical protein
MSGFLNRWSGVTDAPKQPPDSSQALREPRTDGIRESARCLTGSGVAQPDPSSDALKEIAALLTRAYLRQVVVQPVSEYQEQNSGEQELANRRPESVHGGVP